MTAPRRCPNCGADVPSDAAGDLCQSCLLNAGLAGLNPPHLRIRCPHCQHAVEILDDEPLAELTCPSCDSKFSVLGEPTLSHEPPAPKMIGRFEMLERIGVGAFGAVWKARDCELDRAVAMKVPRREQLSSAEAELFLREARAAAQLRHPNIVPVHEVGRHDGQIYIVSDFIDGQSLADWFTGRRATIREAAEFAATIAGAIHHAHEAGVIHRDLKPSNIMLDAALRPHIMDFGLSKRDAAEITMTVEGKVLGTPAYMSPEQARGDAHSADRRSDVYSLGVILFELLTGERPFRGTVRMLLHQVLHDDAPSPRTLDGRIPRDLETICLKCLEKHPEKRYATARELADELHRFLAGEPILARPVTAPQRMWRWYVRHVPLVAGAYTVFSFTILVVMAVLMVGLIQFLIARPSAGDVLVSLVFAAVAFLIYLLGLECGVATVRGHRRGAWTSLVLFALLSVMSCWGFYWSIVISREISVIAISSSLVLQPGTADGWNAYVRNCVIGYAVLGAIWSFLGLILQIHAVRRGWDVEFVRWTCIPQKILDF